MKDFEDTYGISEKELSGVNARLFRLLAKTLN